MRLFFHKTKKEKSYFGDTANGCFSDFSMKMYSSNLLYKTERELGTMNVHMEIDFEIIRVS